MINFSVFLIKQIKC